MTKAEEVAGQCKDPDVWSDLYWRQAFRCVELAQRPEGTHDPAGVRDALQLAEAAVDKARSAYAVARAKTTRGVVMIRAGDLQKAAEDAREAVEGLDPKRHPHEHTSALSVLVSALARGDGQNREEAVGYLEELRRAIPRRYPASRARLQWAKALLYIPNRRRKARARKLLNDARRTFVRLGMADEAVAVLAELTRINPGGAVPKICAEVLAILGEGPIRDLVEKLRTVRMVRRVDVAELLRSAIRGPGVLPAAVWPGP
jgi:tetratricopeptide (TPR) repeat protein